MDNDIQMIRTNLETIKLLSKIKGWYLIRENRSANYSSIVKDLILKDAKRKGLIKDNGGSVETSEEKKNIEDGEEKDGSENYN